MAMLVVIWLFHGGFGVGQINDRGIRLLAWQLVKGCT